MPPSRFYDWRTLCLLLAMYVVLAGNAVLYWTRPLGIAAHIAIGAIGIHLAFTIWHEAVHGNVSRRRWVNDVVGVLGMFPYGTPYFLQKWVHLEHHRALNQPEDPNLIYTDGPFVTIVFRYLRAVRYARTLLAKDPRGPWQKRCDVVVGVATLLLWAAIAWRGGVWSLVALWLGPLVVAKLVMDGYINYLPHVGLPPDRYRGTRVLEIGWLTPLLLGHNYHAVHHVWPKVPWYRYPATFRAERDTLLQHGVPIEHELFRNRHQPAHAGRADPRPG